MRKLKKQQKKKGGKAKAGGMPVSLELLMPVEGSLGAAPKVVPGTGVSGEDVEAKGVAKKEGREEDGGDEETEEDGRSKKRAVKAGERRRKSEAEKVYLSLQELACQPTK